jgi:Bacterial PH domain
VGIGFGFGVPFLLSVAMVATSGDPSLLILPLPFLCGLWVIQGLAPAGYTLEPDGIRIERRWLSRVIPYGLIVRVDREPRAIGGFGAVGLNGLFGSQGPRWNRRTGWHYLAITNTTNLVHIHTRRRLVVLSPSQPDEFAARVGLRIAKED